MKESKIYWFLFVMFLVSIVYYSYNAMLGFADLETTGNFTYGVLGVAIATVLSFLVNTNILHNPFKRTWILYSIWIFGCIPIGIFGFSPALLHVLFPVFTFFFCYLRCSQQNLLKETQWGFIILFVILSLFYWKDLVENGTLVMGMAGSQTNLIYWTLTLFPFIMMLEDKWYKILFITVLSALTLISLKRGALIALVVVLLYYLRDVVVRFPEKRTKIFLGLAIAVLFISSYFTVYTDAALSRFDSVKDDEGSGRYAIWNSIFALLEKNSVIDWLFGNGDGSIKLTGHTSGHNDFLHILFQYGIIGVIFYLAVILNAFKEWLYVKKNIPKFNVACFSALAITIVVGFISDLWVSYTYFAFITAFWGCIEGTISGGYADQSEIA